MNINNLPVSIVVHTINYDTTYDIALILEECYEDEVIVFVDPDTTEMSVSVVFAGDDINLVYTLDGTWEVFKKHHDIPSNVVRDIESFLVQNVEKPDQKLSEVLEKITPEQVLNEIELYRKQFDI